MDYSRRTFREINSPQQRNSNTSQDGYDEARVSEAYNVALLDRQDSGFGDYCEAKLKDSYPQLHDKAMTPSGPTMSTTRSDPKMSENIPPKQTLQYTSTHIPSQQGRSQKLGMDMSVNFHRPRSVTPRSGCRSTTVTNSLPSSNTSSRKSSVVSHNKKSYMPTRPSISAGSGRGCTEDALVLHRQSVQLFAPLSNLPSPPPALTLASRRHTSPAIHPVSHTSRRHQTVTQHSVDQAGSETLGDGPYQYDNFVPASSIDWTHPSTRQREYQKIDQSCRGLRGLWRRLAPRWCQGKSRHLDFFREGDKYDAGSVRRYRIDMTGKRDTSTCGIGKEEFETKVESRSSKAHRLPRYLSFSRDKTPSARDFEASSGGEGRQESAERFILPSFTPAPKRAYSAG